MSPKILRMRFFLLEMVAPADVPVASDFFAMEGVASSLCRPGACPGKNLAARGLGSVETPKTPQARRVPSGTGAAALRRIERMTRRFLPWKAPAHGPALLEAVERRRDIVKALGSVKPRRLHKGNCLIIEFRYYR